jgi:hypothetical protein
LLYAGPEPRHLLPPFAATYPVDYFSLLDCTMHFGMTVTHDLTLVDEIAAATRMLHEGILAWHDHPAALLQQPGEVMSLAGAVTSLIKACKLQCAHLGADSAGMHGAAAAGVSAEGQLAVLQCVLPVAEMLHCLAAELAALLPQAAADRSAASNSRSSSRNEASAGSTGSGNEQQQQKATAVLLAVLLGRSLVALADAADPAAGPCAVLQDDTGCSATTV